MPSAFKEVVLAELKQADLESEPGYDMNVRASQGPNRVELPIGEAFDEYEADPGRRDEIVAGVVAEATRRLDAGIADVSYEDAKGDLMPLLQPEFVVRSYDFDPATTEMPGDLDVVYVVDSDGQFTVVRPEDVERWGVPLEEVHEVALDNLQRQTDDEEPLLCEPSGNWELCGWSTSDGYDATRMIVPGLRRQIVQEYDGDPAVYAAPMNNVFVALPREAIERGNSEELLRTKVARDFQTSDNPVSPELFVERDGELVLLEVSPGDGSGVWAVLVAAGRGDRLGADRPKAFANLGGRPLLAESLERLEASEWIEAVVLVAPADWEEPSILLAEELGAGKVRAAVTGGETRAGSVRAGVAEVPEEIAVLVVHDAARPLLSEAVLERVVTAVGEGWDGAVPALPLDDTVKRADGEDVEETVDRTGLYAVQTPQAFVADRLRARPRRRRGGHRLRRAGGGHGRAGASRRGRPPAREGDDAGRPGLRRGAARGGGVIVDYHMHLRGAANGHEGPVELTVDAVERFVGAGRGARRRRDRVHRAHVLLPPGRAAARAPVPPRSGRARPRRLLRRRARRQGTGAPREARARAGVAARPRAGARRAREPVSLGLPARLRPPRRRRGRGHGSGRLGRARGRGGLAALLRGARRARPQRPRRRARAPRPGEDLRPPAGRGDGRGLPRPGRRRRGRGRRRRRGLDCRPAQAGRRALPGRSASRPVPGARRRRDARLGRARRPGRRPRLRRGARAARARPATARSPSSRGAAPGRSPSDERPASRHRRRRARLLRGCAARRRRRRVPGRGRPRRPLGRRRRRPRPRGRRAGRGGARRHRLVLPVGRGRVGRAPRRSSSWSARWPPSARPATSS